MYLTVFISELPIIPTLKPDQKIMARAEAYFEGEITADFLAKEARAFADAALEAMMTDAKAKGALIPPEPPPANPTPE